MPGRSALLVIIMFTMLFNGGMIPSYLIVNGTGLTNKIWAMIIPNLISTYNMLIIKSYFESLPDALFESARIDGASELTVLTRIAIPLSVPVMMTIGLFYMVINWNVFTCAVLYITKPKLQPLQVVVRSILMQSDQNNLMNMDATLPPMTMQMAAVVIACLPVIIVYPFVQKYFQKGVLLGSIKG